MTQRDLTSPEDCRSMAELRLMIDTLDARLVGLLALRQGYVERAAILKSGRAQVHDVARIEEVVKKVMVEAGRHGLSPKIAERLWRVLIAASIEHEYAAFDRKNPGK